MQMLKMSKQTMSLRRESSERVVRKMQILEAQKLCLTHRGNSQVDEMAPFPLWIMVSLSLGIKFNGDVIVQIS
jgi:hypothetical protein